MILLGADAERLLDVAAPGVDAAHAADSAVYAQHGAPCRRKLLVVGRILDFLGEAVKVYIRKDISMDSLVILVVIPCALFFEKLGLR